MSDLKKTDITLVVDRSGSMQNRREDAEGGINAFIEDQKKGEGEAVLTLVQFDTEYEFVETATPVADVKPYVLNPRGATALCDAVGKAIAEAKERLAKFSDAERPGIVVFAIVTDGQENSSHEYSRGTVRDLIEEQTKAGWIFNFIGADESAFAQASSLGIGVGNTAVTRDAGAAYSNMGMKVNSARSKGAGGQSVGTADFEYTDKEREDLKKDDH